MRHLVGETGRVGVEDMIGEGATQDPRVYHPVVVVGGHCGLKMVFLLQVRPQRLELTVPRSRTPFHKRKTLKRALELTQPVHVFEVDGSCETRNSLPVKYFARLRSQV